MPLHRGHLPVPSQAAHPPDRHFIVARAVNLSGVTTHLRVWKTIPRGQFSCVAAMAERI